MNDFIIICDSPNYIEKYREGNNKTFRLEIGHKVTDCRETEDQLMRSMLEATASALNCVGGTNGRIVAVIKSSLMDSKLSAHSGGDNEAQATLRCAA